MADRRILLGENDIPTRWYNIAPDLPSAPPPPLHPGTREPVGPDDLAPLFPMEIIRQEVSQDREVPIPDEVRALYSMWRPTPLVRALGLEQALGTRSRIFYKYEGVSPAGSHKPNTRAEGVRRLATETGAGQWGSALSFAGALLGLEIKVYMVRTSYDSKPYRRSLIELWGGQVVASPSAETNSGRAILAADPESASGGTISNRYDGTPALARCAEMRAPMVPAPKTATLSIRFCMDGQALQNRPARVRRSGLR